MKPKVGERWEVDTTRRGGGRIWRIRVTKIEHQRVYFVDDTGETTFLMGDNYKWTRIGNTCADCDQFCPEDDYLCGACRART